MSNRVVNLALIVVIVVGVAGLAVAQTTQPQPAAPQPTTQPTSRPVEGNPPAPGFNAEESDARAIEIADEVMKRMGGRAAWDKARHITWKFFAGDRRIFWDRYTNRIRMEGLAPKSFKPYVVLMDLDTDEGNAWQEGLPLIESDVKGALEAVHKYWINDSYWLLMPYKLKDTGVTLKYLGEREMLDGRPADVLQLTFGHVGYTHNNKYHVYVAKETGLVEQWDCFSHFEDDAPYITTPWEEWEPYGPILLPSYFGRLNDLDLRIEDIGVFEEVPENIYVSPTPIDWDNFRRHYPGH